MKKEDKRVRLTRMLLEQALIDLLGEYPISKISVSMLCESAGVSRGSFYANYQDIFDLLEHIEQSTYDELRKYLSEQGTSLARMKGLLEYASDNSKVFQVLIGKNGSKRFQEAMMQLSQEISDQNTHCLDNENPRLQKYVQRFAVTSCVSVLQEWMESGMVEKPEEMAELVLRLLHHGIDYSLDGVINKP